MRPERFLNGKDFNKNTDFSIVLVLGFTGIFHLIMSQLFLSFCIKLLSNTHDPKRQLLETIFLRKIKNYKNDLFLFFT